MKAYPLFLSLMTFLSVLASACSVQEVDPDKVPSFAVKRDAIKTDPATGLPQACTPVTGAQNCTAEGPGQLLYCGADKLCHHMIDDQGCTYPTIGGGNKSCVYTACSNDKECALANPDPNNLTATCIFTLQSNKSDEGGACGFFYKTCSAGKGVCKGGGYLVCKNNECTCSAAALPNATTELCDKLDNDCDGATDEDFPELGQACDGADSDKCANGTWTCTGKGWGTECVNETTKDITELCNGKDDDCDGKPDEDFITLAQDCDGEDADQCKKGKVVCASDQQSVTCGETGQNVVEACNGADDDCDSSTDESCDDDQDGGCDSSMAFATGAACKPGDCNDADKLIYKDAPEPCNSKDDDCDGKIDEDYFLGQICFDGVGVCKVAGTFDKCALDGKSSVCSKQADLSKAVTEICDGLDNDCDSATDEGCDDDKDGYCDTSMTFVSSASGPVCKQTDCNDNVASIFNGATETCDNVDNNCNGEIDEGCDDDKDGWCDAAMKVDANAKCKVDVGKSDCNDTDAKVNPGVDEACTTAYDDNCDGKTDVKADGVTPACDSCANVKKVKCGVEFEIDMATEANAFNAIETYTCWSDAGTLKTFSPNFKAPEVMVVPDAPVGMTFSLLASNSNGQPLVMARLHGSCKPNQGTNVVTAYNPPAQNGTCARATAGVATKLAPKAIDKGVIGEDVISIDSPSAAKVTLKFDCGPPKTP